MSAIFKRILLLFAILIIIRALFAQESTDKLIFSGYTSSLQSAVFQKIDDQWVTNNLIHNRLNFKYLFNENFSSAIELRNRLSFGGDSASTFNTAKQYSFDNGIVDLSTNIARGKSYVLNSSIDRFWLSYEKGKFKTTIGRQRINWGQTFVWNPNDIFNAYSFFDFDYVERPGSDAIRLQYYNSEISATECAIKIDSRKKITAAAMYRGNINSFDYQVLGGMLANNDLVGGFGWSGAIKRMALRGEASYFHPINRASDTTGIILVSVAADYTFSNSLYILAEYLFSSTNPPKNVSFLDFYQAPQTVKNITFVKHSIVMQVSYPITPLINSSFAVMYLPGVKGYYIGPSLSYSLAENLDASIFYQGFRAEIANAKQNFNFLFLRIKWSF